MDMKKILIITTYKNIFTGLTLLILVGILVYLLSIDIWYWRHMQVLEISKCEEVEELIKENERLKGILKSILPKEQKIFYENPYRLYGNRTIRVETTSLKEVIEKGKNIQFSVSYKVPEYLRPIYDPHWAMAYYRGWIYLPW
jgi:hypothetical protein